MTKPSAQQAIDAADTMGRKRKPRQPKDWWEIQADTWPGGKFMIVSERPNATVGSTFALAVIEAEKLLKDDAQIAEVRIYHIVDLSRRYHGVYDRAERRVRGFA